MCRLDSRANAAAAADDDDASPVAPKKAKAAKQQPIAISKNGGLLPPAKKSKAPKTAKPGKNDEEQEEKAEPEAREEIDEHPFSDDGDGDDEEANALAEAVDSDAEDAPQPDPAAGALFKPGQDVGKAPKPAGAPAKQAADAETGVLYVGHIPHGFYEHEMCVDLPGNLSSPPESCLQERKGERGR